MKPLVLDTETTTHEKGNPFSRLNRLCYTGFKAINGPVVTINHLVEGNCTERIQKALEGCTHLVLFNAKFDSHWLMNIGVNLDNIQIWDCQYAEFILENQLNPLPSLENTAVKYELGHKIDVIKKDFWDKGIDTIDIPPELMVEYLVQDVNLTEQVFKRQYEQLYRQSKWRLFQLHMEDQVCLREMERNGILYDVDGSLELAKDAETKVADIEADLRVGYDEIPINFDSSDDLSAYLYGGSITVDTRVPVGSYKTGAKIGQTRYKIVRHTYELPRMFAPPKGSELKKEGMYSTDDKTRQVLRGTREAKKRVDLLDERAKLQKLLGTYYRGFPKIIDKMAWDNNIVHSTFNQCIAITGRLSSSKPNQQNIPPECKRLCISRFQ